MSPRKKAATEREPVTIGISLEHAYAITFDNPALSGHFAVGLNEEKVMISARGLIAAKFPMSRYEVTVKELTPDRFERAEIHYEKDV